MNKNFFSFENFARKHKYLALKEKKICGKT